MWIQPSRDAVHLSCPRRPASAERSIECLIERVTELKLEVGIRQRTHDEPYSVWMKSKQGTILHTIYRVYILIPQWHSADLRRSRAQNVDVRLVCQIFPGAGKVATGVSAVHHGRIRALGINVRQVGSTSVY